MAIVEVSRSEISVSESVEQILGRITNAKDGIRTSAGTIVAPPGWVLLSADGSEEPVYVQVSRIGYVAESPI
jgi:hypothetical protein